MKISVVIPAYNEKKAVGKVVEKTKNLVDEVIITDDCSRGCSDNSSRFATFIFHTHWARFIAYCHNFYLYDKILEGGR
jgi:cellulose synthase/poly-beta-1,6-N-acetylglucosamine synthase-like glycosyltransferase